MNTNNYYIIDIPSHRDDRGTMCVAEYNKEIPFLIRRFFYDFDNVNTSDIRGNHANKHSKFVYICVHGSCSIKVNDGFKEEIFEMNSPSKALFTDKMIWKEIFNFTKDSVLLILSNKEYDSNEYIKSFEEFVKLKRGNEQ